MCNHILRIIWNDLLVLGGNDIFYSPKIKSLACKNAFSTEIGIRMTEMKFFSTNLLNYFIFCTSFI